MEKIRPASAASHLDTCSLHKDEELSRYSLESASQVGTLENARRITKLSSLWENEKNKNAWRMRTVAGAVITSAILLTNVVVFIWAFTSGTNYNGLATAFEGMSSPEHD